MNAMNIPVSLGHPHTYPHGILSPGDPVPVLRKGPRTSRIIVACDHGGNLLPSGFSLGVGPDDLARHIGYDIGAAGVAAIFAEALGAELIMQRYSRLLVDCNRPPSEPTAFPERVDGTDVPGNVGMAPRDAARRVAEVFHPYHAALAGAVETRLAAGITPILIAMHSYTPSHSDFPGERPWPVCVLFNRDPSLSLALSSVLQAEGVNVGENVPYQVGSVTDYTIPVHGEAHGIPHSLVEVRQDLIGTEEGQAYWAGRLAEALPRALNALEGQGAPS